MANSDQTALQGAQARLWLSLTQMTGSSAGLHWNLLAVAMDALESIEALSDPARAGFAPDGFPPAAAPVMRPDRLLLTRSLLMRRDAPAQVAAVA